MELFYDQQDLTTAHQLQDIRFEVLKECGARPLQEALTHQTGFLFGYDRGREEYLEQLGPFPLIYDRPQEREELLSLWNVLSKMESAGLKIPTPKTWRIELEEKLPANLTYPLFVRTETTSWKRGGEQSSVSNEQQLQEEMEALRRVYGWNQPVLAREWLSLKKVGEWRYGEVPLEIRVWVAKQIPVVWTFHYLEACPNAIGFPLKVEDRTILREWAGQISALFTSPLIALDFVLDTSGRWHFLEAAPGGCAGIAHRQAFEVICAKLMEKPYQQFQETYAGTF